MEKHFEMGLLWIISAAIAEVAVIRAPLESL